MTDDLNIPIPPGITKEVLRDPANTGIVGGELLVVYNAETQTGGVLQLGHADQRWMLFHPASKEAFVDIASDMACELLKGRTSELIDSISH
ncbi:MULTISPECIES: hypothetical protein [unclassified Thioalkalivibrio]|uniref:hypothetical protein n=1 Tax=unclassified Thioalkalivibrio TaxID=2621013 RepID=UPI00035F092B|nr:MULTISPECIES: hypothetical protein [unclassified Thioalkalivibrio]